MHLCRICRRQQQNMLGSSCKEYSIFCSILTKFGVYRQIFIEATVSNFMENRPVGSRCDACGRTDRHDESNRRYSRLCEASETANSKILCSSKCRTFVYQYLYSSLGRFPTASGNGGLLIFSVHIQVECRSQYSHKTST